METLMGRAWEATPKKECRYWPGRRISKTSSGIKINYIKACRLHHLKDAGRCDESVKKKEASCSSTSAAEVECFPGHVGGARAFAKADTPLDVQASSKKRLRCNRPEG